MVYTVYRHSGRDLWNTQVPPQRELAETTGLSVQRLRDLLTERAQLHEPSHQALTRMAMACMREQALDAEMPMLSGAIREYSVILER